MVQVNNTPINLRVKFRKVGSLQYVSHLDLVRTMNKIVVRSKLPLWYTEGFNPKPKMVFAAPLSIGTESVCEFMDLRLSCHFSPDDALRMLNENMTDEMQVIEAYYPERKLTELKWLSYIITIKTIGADETLCEKCAEVLSSDSLPVQKKTKSGEALVDIRPLIRSADVSFDGENICITAVLSADQSSFLNPEYVVKVLKEKCGILSSPCLTEEYYSIMRKSAYLDDMSEFR